MYLTRGSLSCGRRRGFTPQLVALYKHLKENTKHQLEVMLVSSDTDETAFNDYFRDMPWLALPFAETKKKVSCCSVSCLQGRKRSLVMCLFVLLQVALNPYLSLPFYVF